MLHYKERNLSAQATISLQQRFMNQYVEETSINYVDAEAKFKEIFSAHYSELRYYAFSIVRDEVMAEEIVQNMFCRLWERADKINLERATRPYLYKTVHNEGINHLKRSKLKAKYQAHIIQTSQEALANTDQADFKLLQEKADQALKDLPTQCRIIFQLSRLEDMKYREIAERLGISVKTVETQMSKALKILRTKLADYLPVVALCILSLKK